MNRRFKQIWNEIDSQTKINSFLTLIIILLTIVNSVFQYNTIKQTKRSLTLNEKSMEMFRDQYVTLNRPYLSLNNVVSTRRNNGMEIRASLHNNGNTPALIVENNFIDLYGNGVKSVSKKNFFINPHEAVGDLFAFVPNESIMDTTPFYTNYLYHSNLVDTTYYIEYWGKIHNGNVMIDSMKY